MHFTSDGLARYLRHRLAEDVAVEAIERFPRGSSRETWFATVRRGQAAPTTLVFRSDLPAGSVEPTPLEQEYFIYERLGHTAVPVAKVLWWEEDASWAGSTFYVREKVDGSWNIPHYSDPSPHYDSLRVAIAKEHLDKLAIVHQVDWRGLGFDQRLPAPADIADAAHTNIETVKRLFAGLAIEAIPILQEAAEWLHDNAPTAPRLSLCKGTNGYGEEVFRDGRIVAMSDWEEASIGDPAADFAFSQDFFSELVRDGEVIWGLEPALEYYRSVSGIAVTAAAVRYYQVFRAFRMLVMAHKSADSVRRATGVFIRQAWTATEVLHLTKRTLATAMGLTPPLPAGRYAQLNVTVDSM
jgi:aminoglycoside phosphotransferase (APT) family kinase protein